MTSQVASPSIALPSPEGMMSGLGMRADAVSPLRGTEVVVDHAALGADDPEVADSAPTGLTPELPGQTLIVGHVRR
jgi:hypothetical protein